MADKLKMNTPYVSVTSNNGGFDFEVIINCKNEVTWKEEGSKNIKRGEPFKVTCIFNDSDGIGSEQKHDDVITTSNNRPPLIKFLFAKPGDVGEENEVTVIVEEDDEDPGNDG